MKEPAPSPSEAPELPGACPSGGPDAGRQPSEASTAAVSGPGLPGADLQWQAALDCLKDSVWLLDPDQRIVRCNRAMADLFEVPVGDLLGRPCWEVMHGTQSPVAECPVVRARASLRRETAEILRDSRWLEVTVDPVLDAAGRYGGAVHIVSDVSARKAAEVRLQQRTEELAALNRLSWNTSVSLALESVVAAALQGMQEAVRTDLAFLFVREGERLVFTGVAPPAARERLGAVLEHQMGEYLCDLVLRQGAALYSRDVRCDDRCARAEGRQAGFVSLAALPLRAGASVIGVVGLASATERDFEGQAGFLEALAGVVSLGLQNARLFEETLEAERTLRESRERLQSVLRAAPTGIGVVADRRLTEVNARIVEMTGYRPEELIGASARVLYPSDEEFDFVGREKYRQIAERGTGTVEARWRRKDGTILDVLLSSTPIDSANLARGVTFTALDITERKQAEAALRESERRLSTLLSNLPGMAYRRLNTPDWKMEFVSEGARELTGYGPSDLVANRVVSYAQVIHPEDRETVWEQVQSALARREPFRLAYRIRRASGEERWVWEQGRGVFDAADELTALEGFIVDVTERKRAEEEVQRLSQWLLHTQRISRVGGWTFSVKTGAVWVSPEARRIYGSAADVPLSLALVQSFPLPQHRPALDRALRELIERGRPYDIEFQIRRGTDGAIADIHSVAEYNAAEGLVLGVVEDITERRRGEAERARLEEQFRQAQKMESVGRLAGGVAHDFNNMLQAILGNAALALTEVPAHGNLRECLEEIQKSAQRSAELTRQLLAFARRQTIHPRVLDLNETVSGMLRMLRRLIGEPIQLAWIPAADLWPVRMDPSQLDQILANLTVNARDAITGDGTVTIETRNATVTAPEVRSRPEATPGDYVTLTVRDTGLGMDPATRAHLFEPFFTTKEVGKGTGLGLATVFGIVQQNRGFIDVWSQPGQGSAFTIHLPRAAAETWIPAATPSPRSVRGSETVLLVEDEIQVLGLGRRILEQQGYTVLSATTPEAALSLAAAHSGPVHLLITDVVMPGMNGQQLRQRLSATRPGLRCLFMSGYTADVIAHEGVLKEGVDFLQKPFTIQSLAERVREVLDCAPSGGARPPGSEG